MYNGHIVLCGLGLLWGVFMAVWDVMIAAGTYYRAFRGGDRVQGFLYFEVALGFILCGLMVTSLLLVYKGSESILYSKIHTAKVVHQTVSLEPRWISFTRFADISRKNIKTSFMLAFSFTVVLF